MLLVCRGSPIAEEAPNMIRTLHALLCLLIVVPMGLFMVASQAQEPAAATPQAPFRTPPDLETVPPEKWAEIDKSVDSALNWLASRQEPDGSFPTFVSGQPAVTSLGVLAFLSAGEQPGVGEHGKRIDRAIDFALSCQRDDDLFILDSTDMPATQFER